MYLRAKRRDTLVPDSDWLNSQGRCIQGPPGAQGCQDGPQSLADGSGYSKFQPLLHYMYYLHTLHQ